MGYSTREGLKGFLFSILILAILWAILTGVSYVSGTADSIRNDTNY